MERESAAPIFQRDGRCLGFCNDLQLRKMAVIAARDNVNVKGRCGSEIFPEYNSKGLKIVASLKKGRGITLAAGIKRPVVTDHIVVCCCIKLALFIMDVRNSVPLAHSESAVQINWEELCGDSAMFARHLTDERGDGFEYREDTCSCIATTCRQVRQNMPPPKRGLVILKTYGLEKLSADKVDRMIATGKWGTEIAKRVGENFQYGEYADIILPLTFGDHWVMLVCNYEARSVTIVYFKRET